MLAKPKKIKKVYLDHAAATPLDSQVFLAMKPFFNAVYGNPSSLHSQGQQADKALGNARNVIAHSLGAHPENIIFTSSGTESDNLAIYGIAKAHAQQGRHIISTILEHDAVLKPLEDLKKQGWHITYIQADSRGLIKTDDVIAAIRPDTVLISLMYANNEIGTINPIAEIGRKLLQYRKNNNTAYPLLHTDACQAVNFLDISVEKLHVDLMSVNGSKIYGPKGTGFLYVRSSVLLEPTLLGGGQEKNLRSGTENIPGIVGLAKAMELAQKSKIKESKRVENLAQYFWGKVQKQVPGVTLNGPAIGINRLVNNVNINFADIEGEALLLYLDAYGIMCSTGSACSSKTLETSHVLKALGMNYQESQGSVRFSFGKENTKEQIDYTMKYLPKIVEQLRQTEKIK
ncbi:MAG: cysteine desulfurase [Candidatus Magasanikbacteria bacterium]|nr:cysteine desulfurase [Candidatus Magasanikbacteria bacterium]